MLVLFIVGRDEQKEERIEWENSGVSGDFLLQSLQLDFYYFLVENVIWVGQLGNWWFEVEQSGG